MRPEGRSQASECCRGRPRRLVRAVRGRRRLASCDETIQVRPSKGAIWGMSVYPRVGFIVTNMTRPAERVSKFYNGRGTAEQ